MMLRRAPARRWISTVATVCVVLAGLTVPGSGAEPVESGLHEKPISEDDRQHWSLQPLQRPPLPHVRNSEWARNPIDLFIQAAWERKGIEPLPEAPPEVLMRRLSFNLVGLPPHAVSHQAAPDAPWPAEQYGREVERLLNSPHYGEHWAQYWLDLARFAETDGFEHDQVRPDAWRYRDWVIAAFNADLPYDYFVRQQLAGDEVPVAAAAATSAHPGQQDAAVATMFCLAGPDMPDINLQQERRDALLNGIVATVGSVFLGLQMECAQCHDHKYDAISQADFYRLRAVFQPAVHVRKNKSVGVLKEEAAPDEPSHLMVRGDFRRPGPRLEPAAPRLADIWQTELHPQPQGASSGRRTALAQWLTRPDHPLTARVFVNRLWQYHFGTGLSTTPSDFGVMGDEPLLGELLDWLAVELVEHDWSIKHLQRLIVSSSTFRLASFPQPSTQPAWRQVLEADPQNRYFSRYPRRRVSGEALRDAMLSVAGLLSFEQGGPGIRPPLPDELRQTLLKDQWHVSPDASDHVRRSIYIFARRNLRYPLFEAFDRPDANASCAMRPQSTTALQSLLLLNSELSEQCAAAMAERLLAQSKQPEAQVRSAVRWAFGRSAEADEVEQLTAFLEDQADRLQQNGPSQPASAPSSPGDTDDSHAAALRDLCLALLNTNEFLYID